MTRAERLARFLKSLTKGPNVGIVQCSKKLPEELAKLFPGYDRGIKLQTFAGWKYECWWLAGTNNEEGFSIVAVVCTGPYFVVCSPDLGQELLELGGEPEIMWQAIADRIEEQKPYFEAMHEKCIGGLRSAESLAFIEVCDRPTDSAEKILDTLAGLKPGSIVRLNWQLFRPGDGHQNLHSARAAAANLERLVSSGAVTIADEFSQVTLGMIREQDALDFQHTRTDVELNQTFDLRVFAKQVVPGVESVSIV